MTQDRIEHDALGEVRRFITSAFGEKYLEPTPRVFAARAGAQEAHEAIRPTSAERTPESVRAFLSLYWLIPTTVRMASTFCLMVVLFSRRHLSPHVTLSYTVILNTIGFCCT